MNLTAPWPGPRWMYAVLKITFFLFCAELVQSSLCILEFYCYWYKLLLLVQIDIIPLNINSSLKPKFGTEPSYYDQRLLFISGLEATWPCGLIWEKNVEDTVGTRIIM